MLHSAELKIADDFKDGDVLSASVFNQIFDTIERVSGTVKDPDLLGVWNCNAISSNSLSGWIQDGFLFKVNDSQINLSASSSSRSLDNPYSIATSNPNPFNWSNSSAFIGQYVLLNNHLIIKRDSDSSATVWDLDLVSKSRFELTYEDTASSYANFISCDSATAVPAAPTGPAAINNKTSILLSWTDSSSDESGFKVYRKKSGESDFQLVSTQTTTSYSDTALNEGETANYYIKSYNQNGDSNQSNVVVATLDSIAPTVASTTPNNGATTNRTFTISITFSEEITVICPNNPDVNSSTFCTTTFPPTPAPAVGPYLRGGSSQSVYIGGIGSPTRGLNISGVVSNADANQNITVTVNKEWIQDLNGNVMTSDFQFSFNVGDT